MIQCKEAVPRVTRGLGLPTRFWTVHCREAVDFKSVCWRPHMPAKTHIHTYVPTGPNYVLCVGVCATGCTAMHACRGVCVCVWVRACMRVYVCACACVRVCMSVQVHVMLCCHDCSAWECGHSSKVLEQMISAQS
jgi:hypothetical protein